MLMEDYIQQNELIRRPWWQVSMLLKDVAGYIRGLTDRLCTNAVKRYNITDGKG